MGLCGDGQGAGEKLNARRGTWLRPEASRWLVVDCLWLSAGLLRQRVVATGPKFQKEIRETLRQGKVVDVCTGRRSI